MTPQRRRAWLLLRGGVLGLLVAGLPAIAISGVAVGASGAGVAAIGGGVVLVFFALGQSLQWAVADSTPQVALFVALASYALRVVLLGGLLSAALSEAGPVALNPAALLGGTLAATVGWITGEVIAFTRLRIPVFDSTEAGSRRDAG